MRIQHNIAAMNSYRNYNNNVKAVNKNLEKLSSGYKVNRAGDDAAGLAISEKMRAQITGLDAAQKNVKDGISLVKTAEGAMQEIQDMLNRMDYLATQSANGTYDNEVDRANLQKEVANLKTEINRIADSANFNGIKLLDGSLDSGATKAVDSLLKTFAKDADGKWIDPTDITATTGTYTSSGITGVAASLTDGDLIKFSIDIQDENGNVSRQEITLKAEIKDLTNKTYNLMDENGRVMGTTTDDKPGADVLSAAIVKSLKENTDLDETFNITANSDDQVSFVAYAPGRTLQVVGMNVSTKTYNAANSGATKPGSTSEGWVDMKIQLDDDVKTAGAEKIIVGEDKTYAFDLKTQGAAVWDGKDKTLEDSILEIDGHKFMFVAGTDSVSVNNALVDKMTAAGVEGFVQLSTTTATDATGIVAADVKTMVEEMRQATGLDIVQGDTATTSGKFVAGTSGTNDTSIRIINDKNGKGVTGDGGLTLQIGDTSDKFNQMKVSIGDMHTKAMGKGTTTLDGKTVTVNKTVADIDIGNQEGAAEAVAVIKNAINYVSSIRGDLGAVQNRLDHTANNLSVMTENIQDAESTIRDTDVADEMMSYTKNNILIQSAQAMLAQANQIPQGVLQLLG